MSNNKQSSVEWLISQLQKSKDWHRVLNEISQMSSARFDILEQAQEMHKEEIKEAHERGQSDEKDYWNIGDKVGVRFMVKSKEYYNETFGE